MALVTGAGWGNGRATAVRFAEEGAKVFAVDLSGEAMKETFPVANLMRRAVDRETGNPVAA
jgi:NAD(P)-dependent dehydrogenase (short-subunit alcohol dehydrogenase family)